MSNEALKSPAKGCQKIDRKAFTIKKVLQSFFNLRDFPFYRDITLSYYLYYKRTEGVKVLQVASSISNINNNINWWCNPYSLFICMVPTYVVYLSMGSTYNQA